MPDAINHLAMGLIKNRNEQGSNLCQNTSISQHITTKNQPLSVDKNEQRVIQSTRKILEKTIKSEKLNSKEEMSTEEVSERKKIILEIKWLDQLNEGYDLLHSSQSIAYLKDNVNDTFKNFVRVFFLKSKEIKACQSNYINFYKVFLNAFPELKETKNFRNLEIPLLFLAIKFSCQIEVTDLISFLLVFDKKDEKKIYNFFHETEDWLSEIVDLVDEEGKLRSSLSALDRGKEILNKEISYLEIKNLFDKNYKSWTAEFNKKPIDKKELEIFKVKSFYSAGLPELKELNRVANSYVENILKMENFSELNKKPYLDNLQIAALFLAFKVFSEGINLKKFISSFGFSNEQRSLLTLEHCIKSEAWLLKALDWKVNIAVN